jgi:hypothetical protein
MLEDCIALSEQMEDQIMYRIRAEAAAQLVRSSTKARPARIRSRRPQYFRAQCMGIGRKTPQFKKNNV